MAYSNSPITIKKNNMKKLILMMAIIGLTISVNAQSQKMVDKAESYSEYVAKAMDLNDVDKLFLNVSLLNSYKDAAERKKGLSKEEKKVVNKEIRVELKTELGKTFSKEEVKEIFTLMKEKRELDKK